MKSSRVFTQLSVSIGRIGGECYLRQTPHSGEDREGNTRGFCHGSSQHRHAVGRERRSASRIARKSGILFGLVLVLDPNRRALNHFMDRASGVDGADFDVAFLTGVANAARKVERSQIPASDPWPKIHAVLTRTATKFGRRGWHDRNPRMPGVGGSSIRRLMDYDVERCGGSRLESQEEEYSWTAPLALIEAEFEAEAGELGASVFRGVIAYEQTHGTRHGAYKTLGSYAQRSPAHEIVGFFTSPSGTPPSTKIVKAIRKLFESAEATMVRILQSHGYVVPSGVSAKPLKKSKSKRKK